MIPVQQTVCSGWWRGCLGTLRTAKSRRAAQWFEGEEGRRDSRGAHRERMAELAEQVP